MKVIFSTTLFICCILIKGNNSEEEEEFQTEELPSPSQYRRPISPPLRRLNTDSAYNDGDAFKLLNDYRNVDRELTRGTTDDDSGLNRNGYDGGDYAYSASEYGGYASDSGYGLTCASGYVNASAVALLAFLFLLNIVQDVIQQITGGARRKRQIPENLESNEEEEIGLNSAMQFLSNGGLDSLKEGLPDIIIDLLVKLSRHENPKCQQRPLCEANLILKEKFGTIGYVFGTLSSNVLSKTFSGESSTVFHSNQKAARFGRDNKSCEIFEVCEFKRKNSINNLI